MEVYVAASEPQEHPGPGQFMSSLACTATLIHYFNVVLTLKDNSSSSDPLMLIELISLWWSIIMYLSGVQMYHSACLVFLKDDSGLLQVFGIFLISVSNNKSYCSDLETKRHHTEVQSNRF